MISVDDQTVYRQRADMHEQLAASTNDLPARKMHLAMAAEYRRRAKALDMSLDQIPAPSADRLVELDAAI